MCEYFQIEEVAIMVEQRFPNDKDISKHKDFHRTTKIDINTRDTIVNMRKLISILLLRVQLQCNIAI